MNIFLLKGAQRTERGRVGWNGLRRQGCETGWHKYSETRCIISPNIIGTAFEAHSQCADYNGKLIQIQDKRDLHAIQTFMKNVPIPLDVYIGLRWNGGK